MIATAGKKAAELIFMILGRETETMGNSRGSFTMKLRRVRVLGSSLTNAE